MLGSMTQSLLAFLWESGWNFPWGKNGERERETEREREREDPNTLKVMKKDIHFFNDKNETPTKTTNRQTNKKTKTKKLFIH